MGDITDASAPAQPSAEKLNRMLLVAKRSIDEQKRKTAEARKLLGEFQSGDRPDDVVRVERAYRWTYSDGSARFCSKRPRDDEEDDVEAVREEFKRYKIKAQVQRKQLEEEKESISSEAMRFKQHNVVGRDLAVEVRELRRRVERCEQEKVILQKSEAAAAERHAAELSALRERASATPSDAAYRELKKEFEVFKDRALDAILERERDVSRLSSPSSGGARRGVDESVGAYARNVLLEYLSSSDPKRKEHMEGALATAMRFTPAEIERIRKAKVESAAPSLLRRFVA